MGHRVAAYHMRIDYLFNRFRGNVPIKYSGTAGKLHVQQGLGEAQSKTAHLGDGGPGFLTLQPGFQRRR